MNSNSDNSQRKKLELTTLNWDRGWWCRDTKEASSRFPI